MPLPANVIGGPAQLTWYIGQDDCLYAHELQTNCLFQLTESKEGEDGIIPPAGVPEAPTDGKLYGRENASWAEILAAGSLTMTSPDGQSVTTLTLVDGGDVVATATMGPNTGKSVNLTYGKWV